MKDKNNSLVANSKNKKNYEGRVIINVYNSYQHKSLTVNNTLIKINNSHTQLFSSRYASRIINITVVSCIVLLISTLFLFNILGDWQIVIYYYEILGTFLTIFSAIFVIIRLLYTQRT